MPYAVSVFLPRMTDLINKIIIKTSTNHRNIVVFFVGHVENEFAGHVVAPLSQTNVGKHVLCNPATQSRTTVSFICFVCFVSCGLGRSALVVNRKIYQIALS